MASLNRAELRQELEVFAQQTLERQLLEFAKIVQEQIRSELGCWRSTPVLPRRKTRRASTSDAHPATWYTADADWDSHEWNVRAPRAFVVGAEIFEDSRRGSQAHDLSSLQSFIPGTVSRNSGTVARTSTARTSAARTSSAGKHTLKPSTATRAGPQQSANPRLLGATHTHPHREPSKVPLGCHSSVDKHADLQPVDSQHNHGTASLTRKPQDSSDSDGDLSVVSYSSNESKIADKVTARTNKMKSAKNTRITPADREDPIPLKVGACAGRTVGHQCDVSSLPLPSEVRLNLSRLRQAATDPVYSMEETTPEPPKSPSSRYFPLTPRDKIPEIEENDTMAKATPFSVEEPADQLQGGCIRCIVNSWYFDQASALVIITNCVSIGLQADHMAKVGGGTVPTKFRVMDITFCCVFTMELVMRTIAYGKSFFSMVDWRWNVFDTLLVIQQIIEESLTIASGNTNKSFHLSTIRVLRVLRLVRIVRLFRVMRLVGELRLIIASIASCVKSLFWTIVLLFLIIYVFAVVFTQLASDHLDELRKKDLHIDERLLKHYGSLGKSILSFFQAMSGGVDWEEMSNPVIEEISPVYGIIFSFYIAFVMFAVLNVVTGVFVESAVLSAKEDKELYMVNQLRHLLKNMDSDFSGTITWDEFRKELTNPQMREVFKAIDIELTEEEAKGLFMLLDLEGEGCVRIEDFLSGIMRLIGPAKSLEQQLLMHELRRLSKRNILQARAFESKLTDIGSRMVGAEKA